MAERQIGTGKRRLSAKEFLRLEKKRHKMNPQRGLENRENCVNDNTNLGKLNAVQVNRFNSTGATGHSAAPVASVDSALGSSLRRSVSVPLSRHTFSDRLDGSSDSSKPLFATFKPSKNMMYNL